MSSDTPSERLDVNGMVAVVTGGAGGIGKGIVTALLQRGATVVIADIEADTTQATVAELSDLGPVSGWPADVADEGSVAALADHVYDAHGR
ncbi:MAG: SDR family NAD(P)-dependent oxidoreductase, partial [bacterium]|nr:SDR family NAD(P)-dependent oxidoreductase [bacterium]